MDFLIFSRVRAKMEVTQVSEWAECQGHSAFEDMYGYLIVYISMLYTFLGVTADYTPLYGC